MQSPTEIELISNGLMWHQCTFNIDFAVTELLETIVTHHLSCKTHINICLLMHILPSI